MRTVDGSHGFGALGRALVLVVALAAVQAAEVQASAGAYHALLLDADGRVWGWGGNFYGNVGQPGGSGQQVNLPTVIPGLGSVRKVAAGAGVSYALKQDGTVWSWGNDAFGMLGDGAGDSTGSVPRQVAGLSGVMDIAAGGYNGYALLTDGTVRSWGRAGALGQTADGSGGDAAVPGPVLNLQGIVALAAGNRFAHALNARGRVWSWGVNDGGQLGTGNTTAVPAPVLNAVLPAITGIAAGGAHSLFRSADGRVWACGSNAQGQVGTNPVLGTTKATPVQVSGISGVKAVACCQSGSITLGADGTVSTWGVAAILGDGSTAARWQPTVIPTAALSLVKQVAGGMQEAVMALRAEGTLRMWGDSQYSLDAGGGGSAVVNRASPIAIPTLWPLTAIQQVACGNLGNLALKADGTVWASGGNPRPATMAGGNNAIYEQVPGLEQIIALVGGRNDSGMALRADGTVYSWGDESGANGGSGTRDAVGTPALVRAVGGGDGTTLTGAVEMAYTNYRRMVRLADGTVAVWGQNSSGECGIGASSAAPLTSPTLARSSTYSAGAWTLDAAPLAGVASIFASQFSLGALTAGGILYTAGGGPVGGQTLAGATPPQSSFVAVNFPASGLAPTGVTSRYHNAVARMADGSVNGWGGEYLGDGSSGSTASASPVAVAAAGSARSLGTCGSGGLFIRGDGTAVFWGANSSGTEGGRAGTGSTNNVLSPQAWPAVGAVAAVVGDDTVLGLLGDGRILVSGYYAGSGVPSANSAILVPTAVSPTWLPQVSVTAGGAAAEPSTPGSVIVARTYATTGTLQVQGSVSLTGSGSISPLGAVTATIPAGASTAALAVTPVDDVVASGTRSITTAVLEDGPGAYRLATVASATISFLDNDTVGVSTSRTSVATAESGTTDAFTVTLLSRPATTVSIPISSSNTAEALISLDGGATWVASGTLAIAPANWNSPQTVKIKGVDDAVADGVQAYTVVLGACTGDAQYAGFNPADVSGTNADDDVAGVRINGTLYAGTPVVTAAATEGGSAVSAAVRLNSQPTATVTVTVSGDSAVQATPAALTFTTTSWSTPQTVSITVPHDSIDNDGRSGTVTISPSGGGYGSSMNASARVPITDVDTAALVIAPASDAGSPLALTEAAGATHARSLSLSLATIPAGNVILTLASSATTTATISPATLTFTPSSWNAVQTATITAVDDQVDDGSGKDAQIAIGVDAASADAAYRVLGGTVYLAVADDDANGIGASPAAIAVQETGGATAAGDGTSATITVALGAQPSGTVKLRLAISDGGAASFAQPSLGSTAATRDITFTASGYSTTATIWAINNAAVDGDRPFTITATVLAGTTAPGYAIGAVTTLVSGTVRDDDGASGGVVTDRAELALGEAASLRSGIIRVRLLTPPGGAVTVAAALGGPFTIGPASASFDASTWNTYQSFTVTALNDEIAQGTATGSVTFTADASYGGVSTSVPLSRSDNDTAALLATATQVVTDEEGGGVSVGFRLQSEPSATVTVTLANGDAAGVEGVLSPAGPLTFTPDTWNAIQTVTITGKRDFVDDGDATYVITATASQGGGSMEYGGKTLAVTVSNQDVDTAGVVAVASGGATDEAGTLQPTIRVHLAAKPASGTVQVPLRSSNAEEGLLQFPAASAWVDAGTLTFTTADWDVDQVVAVRGVGDDREDGDVAYAVLVDPLVSAGDAAFAGLVPSPIPFTNRDDPASPRAGITATVDGVALALVGGTWLRSGTAVEVAEDPTAATHSRQVAFVLASQPLAAVTLVLASSASADGVVAPGQLTFTPAAWDQPQTATITAVADLSGAGDRPFTLTVSAVSADPLYDLGSDAAQVPQPAFGKVDDDGGRVGIVVSSSALTTQESGAGQAATLAVSLATEPSQGVTVLLARPATAPATLSVSSLSFTTADWYVPRSVTVTAVADAVATGNIPWTLDLAASGGEYGGRTAAVPVTFLDDDTAGLLVTGSNGLTTSEAGGTAQFQVALTSQPTGAVDVLVASDDAAKGVVTTGATLHFSPATWNLPQPVGIAGVPDDPPQVQGPTAYGVVVQVDAASADATYAALPAVTVPVVRSDADAAHLLITTSGPAETAPGGELICQVALSSRPTAEVQVAITSSNPALGEVTAGATLVFAPDVWDVPQEVTVLGGSNNAGDQLYQLQAAASASAGSLYDGVTADFPITSLANQPPLLEIDPGLLTGMVRGDTVDLAGVLMASDVETWWSYGLIYTLRLPPAQGTIRLNGLPVPAQGTFSQADVEDGLVTYRHNDSLVGRDGFAVQVEDADGGVSTIAVVPITINVGQEQPDVTLSQTAITWDESVGIYYVTLDPDVVVSDPDSSGYRSGARLRVSITGASTPERRLNEWLRILSQGLGPGQIYLYGNGDVDFGGETFAFVEESGQGTDLLVNLHTNASDAAVTALLRAIGYTSNTYDPGDEPRTITVTVDDGNGGPLKPRTIALSVLPYDDTPVPVDFSVVVAKDFPATGAVPLEDGGDPIDPDTPADGLAVAVIGQPVKGALAMAADGAFTYTPFPGETGQDAFTYTVSDASSTSSLATCTVTISAGQRPWIVSDPPLEAVQGEPLRIDLQVDARDLPGTPSLTWSLVGSQVPSGTTLTATGALTVSLRIPAVPAGDYLRFAVQVLNHDDASGTGSTALQQIMVRILPLPAGGG